MLLRLFANLLVLHSAVAHPANLPLTSLFSNFLGAAPAWDANTLIHINKNHYQYIIKRSAVAQRNRNTLMLHRAQVLASRS